MRVCVLGNGRMGKNHARVLRELGHDVVTVDPDREAEATLQHNAIPRPASLPEAFDAACIAVPIPQLAECAERALRLGVDTLVEKPGAESADRLLALHALAAENDCRLFVGYVERFNPVVDALKLAMGNIGPIRHITIRRLGRRQDLGTDPTLDLAVHDLDLLVALGIPAPLRTNAVLSSRHLSAMLETDAGITVSLEASHLHPTKLRQVEVLGDDGVLVADLIRRQLSHITATHNGETVTVPLPVERTEPLRAEWEAFISGDVNPGVAAIAAAEQLSIDAARTAVRPAA